MKAHCRCGERLRCLFFLGALALPVRAAVGPGSLDPTFRVGPLPINSPGFRVRTLAVQSDDRILVGGGFTQWNGAAAPGLVRLLPNGSLDAPYLQGLNDHHPARRELRSMVLLPDDRLVFSATELTAAGIVGALARTRHEPSLARLLTDGSLDGSFLRGGPKPDGTLLSNAVQILAVQPSGGLVVQSDGLRSLTPAGAVDGIWPRVDGDPLSPGTFLAAAAQNSGRIVVFGQFHDPGGRDPRADRLYRLGTNGGVDATFPTWQPLAAGGRFGMGDHATVRRILIQPDDKILLVGTFRWLTDGHRVEPRGSIARLNADGTLDDSFDSRDGFTDFYRPNDLPQWHATNSRSAFTAALSPDGRIVVGGYFDGYNGVSRPNLVRLNLDGSLDASFVPPQPARWITQVAVQSDGKVIVSASDVAEGGGFPPFAGSEGIVRLEGGPLALAAPAITLQPLDQSVTTPVPGGAVTFSLEVADAASVTYRWFYNGIPLGDGARVVGAAAATLRLLDVQQIDAGRYECEVANAGGRVLSSPAFLTVNNSASPGPDRIAPRLTVNFPAPTVWRTDGSAVSLRGTASDNLALGQVLVQKGNGPFHPVSGLRDWTSRWDLDPGTNVFHLKAVDLAGNTSAISTRVIVYVLSAGFTLNVNGRGNVARPALGNSLEVGRTYSLKATPKPGNLFSNWVVGPATYTQPTLNFLMTSDMDVTANFVANPFPALAGTYVGLFFDSAAPAHEQAGCFSFKLAGDGGLSGKITCAGVTAPAAGHFDLALHAEVTASFPGGHTNVLHLQLTGGSEAITGTADVSGTAVSLSGHRAPTTPSPGVEPVAPRSTLVLSPALTADGRWLGHGFATMTVHAGGRVRVRGELADGTSWVSSGFLSSSHAFPVYMTLPRGRGSFFGWLRLGAGESSGSSVDGSMLWTKLGALTNRLSILGSAYVPPRRGERAVPWDSAVLIREAGGLAVTNLLSLDGLNRFEVAEPNEAGLEVNLKVRTGEFTGRFESPDPRHSVVRVRGVILQSLGAGGGVISGDDRSGAVYVGPPTGYPLFP